MEAELCLLVLWFINLSELVSPAPQAFLGMFAKLQNVTISFVLSVHLFICPCGTAWLKLDTFPLDLIFEYLSKIKSH